MKNNTESQINKLHDIAKGGIRENKFNHEFKDILKTLDIIKEETEKGKASKEQIKRIINFLDNQIKSIPNGDFVMTNKLNTYKQDFILLQEKINTETFEINTKSKKDTNKIIDEAILNGQITEEKAKSRPQINFSKNERKTFETQIDLNNLNNYKVQSGDNLWNIVKKHYPELTKNNKDIIHIVNYIVNLNTKLEPSKLKHLMRDDKIAWGKKGSDGIAGDTLRIGDILKLPKIKKEEKVAIIKKTEKKEVPEHKKKEKQDHPEIKKEEKITNTDESNSNTYVEHYIFENGRVLLIGKDGEKKESSRELSKEELEKIQSFKKVAILNEILDIWKTEANNIVDGLFWKESRNDDDIILKQISGIEKDFSNLFGLIQTNKIDNSQINIYINEIFKKIQIAESEESIIGPSDMEIVKDTLLSNSNKDSKLRKIFNLMRYKGLSGNSNTVKEKVSNHLLASKDFKYVSEILTNQNLLPYIENNNKTELSRLFNNEELAEDILEAYNKIKVKQEQHRSEYSKILEKINKEKKSNGKPEIKLNDFIKLNVDYSIQTLVKHTLIESKINSMTNRGNENSSYTGIYANLSGLASTSSGDILVIADDNIDTAIDIGTTLAISAISMGVGALAARGAMMAVNYGSKALKIGEATTRIGSLARFGGTATIEGTSFYMGTNTMNNLIYGNFEGSNIGENNLNGKEIIKSIAFMGVFRGASKIMEAAGKAQMTEALAKTLNQKATISKTEKLLAGFGNLTSKVPPLMFKQTSITGILVEAGLLTGTSVGLEIAFEGEGEWTLEEYLQALVMVGLFKGASKIKFGKNKNGEIQAEVNKSTETSKESTYESYIHKKTGKEYIKGSDGKFREPKTGKIRNVKEENLQKVENNTIKETISEKDYETFVNTGKISDKILDTIAKKVKKGEKLSKYEESIFTSKTKEINDIISKTKKEVTSKKINSLFEKQFTKKINDEGKLTIDDKTYKKRLDGKYEITGDNTLYTKKEILEKISQKDKVKKLQEEAQNKVTQLEAGRTIEIKDGFFDWKGKYKVSKDEIIIKENGIERKLSSKERTQFYKDNYQEILGKMGLNIKKDSENIINKIKDKLNGSKGADLISSMNKFLDSIPGLGHIYKGTKWVGKQGIDSMLTPYHIVKNIKNAKGFEETMKSIIFANKDIGYLKGAGKMVGTLAIPTIGEIIYETNTNPQGDMKLSGSNILSNYGELMYLGVINTLIIESLNIDETLLNETP